MTSGFTQPAETGSNVVLFVPRLRPAGFAGRGADDESGPAPAARRRTAAEIVLGLYLGLGFVFGALWPVWMWLAIR